jgi:hypothetical protein
MNIKIQIAIEDKEIQHIGVDQTFGNECVIFRDNKQNEIILEKLTLQRGLAIFEAYTEQGRMVSERGK